MIKWWILHTHKSLLQNTEVLVVCPEVELVASQSIAINGWYINLVVIIVICID